MQEPIIAFLNQVGGTVFQIAAMLFLGVNVAAAAVVAVTRSREVVNRWTSPWLAVNLALLGAGIGVPLLAGIAKVAVLAIAGAGGFTIGSGTP